MSDTPVPYTTSRPVAEMDYAEALAQKHYVCVFLAIDRQLLYARRCWRVPEPNDLARELTGAGFGLGATGTALGCITLDNVPCKLGYGKTLLDASRDAFGVNT